MQNPVDPEIQKILSPPAPPQEGAPIFGTWRRAYAAVVIAFAAQVALLWALSRWFS